MTIQTSNIYTEGYKIVKDFLNANISDTRKRFKKNWIHASPPDVTAKGFDGYPFITIKHNNSQQRRSLNWTTYQNNFRIQIAIYSNEATDVDTLSDELYDKMNNKSLSVNLNSLSVKNISSSDVTATVVNGVKIYSRVFVITAKFRLGDGIDISLSPSGSYTVSGSLSPDATGVYEEDGVYGGKMSYARAGEYYIWWGGSMWVISQSKGLSLSPSWSRFSADIVGSYDPTIPGTTGVATVL